MTAETAIARIGPVVKWVPFEYASSWPLELVVVDRPAAGRVELLLKHCGGEPDHERSLEREVIAYLLLGDTVPGVPVLIGWGSGWLLIENVDGQPVWQHGDLDSWCTVASWAAALHGRFASHPPALSRLMRYDRRSYQNWFVLARRNHPGAAALDEAVGAAARRLDALPRTLIHGQLYASNVLVAGASVAVIDWETAGIGAGVLDLAALVAGWDPASRNALVDAYDPSTDPLDLAAAELLLALRWLGLPLTWEPPPQHRRDWLSEARASARLLG